MNNPFRKAIGAIAVGTIIVGGAYIRQQQGGTTTPPPPPSGLANIFVDTNGGSCTWTGVPLSYTTGGDAKSCSSFDLANKAATTAAATSGTVLVENGTYPQQVLLASGRSVTDGTCTVQPTGSHYTEVANYTGCVTFSPDTNQTPTFDGIQVLTAGVRFVGLTNTNPTALTNVNTTENIGVTVSWLNTPTGTACKTVPQPHDVVFDQMHVYINGGTPSPGAAPNSGAYITGVYNISVINSDFGPVYDNPATWQTGNLIPTSSAFCNPFSVAQLQDNHIYIGHNNLHDFIQDVGSNLTNCGPPISDPTEYGCNHAEGIHWRASNSWLIGNRFTNIEQQSISAQTDTPNNPSITNTAFVGNVFDAPCSNQPSPPCTKIGAATFIANGFSDTLTNDLIGFNSLNGAFTFNNDGQGGSPNPAPYPGTVVIGNIYSGFAGNGTSGGCPIQGSFLLNATTSSTLCGTDYNISAFPYTNAAAQDFTLTGTPDVSNKIAPSTTVGSVTALCPALDISLLTRPAAQFANCANGAYEPPVTTVTGASLASCTGGTCTEGALPSTTFSNDCTATPLPGFATDGTGKGVRLGTISDGVNNECRGYYIYVPVGLQGAAPVLVYAHGSNGCPDSAAWGDLGSGATGLGLDALANTNKFIVVSLEMPKPCSGRPTDTFALPTQLPPANYQWFHHQADVPDSGSLVPQDQTYIQAVVADVKARFDGSSGSGFSGLTTDANRFWFMGQSSGGGLSTAVMCVDATSSLFRGVAYDGLGYNVATTGGTSPTPINGTERCGGGGQLTPTNKNFFVSMVLATTSKTGLCATSFHAGNPSDNGHCTPTWTETLARYQSYFGCASTTPVPQGSPNAINESDTFTCAYGASPQVQLWYVSGSGDGYGTADDVLNNATNTNGWRFQRIFDFLNNSSWNP